MGTRDGRERGVLLHYFRRRRRRRHRLLTNKVADPEGRKGGSRVREGARRKTPARPILERIPNEPAFSLHPPFSRNGRDDRARKEDDFFPSLALPLLIRRRDAFARRGGRARGGRKRDDRRQRVESLLPTKLETIGKRLPDARRQREGASE